MELGSFIHWSGRSSTSLGWKEAEKLPSYFDRDFPKDVYGECEATGHRCDFFLLVWHGPNPVSGEMRRGDAQSNPENYDYFIVPVSDWPGAKKVQAKQLFESYEPIGFADLPARLNLVADGFLESMQAARV